KMPPMWFKMIKVLVLLFALFTTLQAKDLNKILEELFIVNDDKGLHLFNTTTTADSAPSSPVMPIPTMPGAQPQGRGQSPVPTSHYHQYHGLSQPDQYFKVQRSPDGKLNLVFNDTFVSLQGTNGQALAQTQSNPVPNVRKPQSDTFVFPGPTSIHRRNESVTAPPQPSVNMSSSSQCGDEGNQESKSFCTQVDNYPDLSALKQKLAGKFARFFNDDLVQPTDVSARVGSAEDEVSLCRTKRHILYPKKGLKADNSWQLIVNDEEFKQGIQIEECEEKDLPCDYAENFPLRFKPVCRQHYVMRNLASIPNTGQLDVVQDVFKIPSCCKCVLVKV
ncbi:hypothetical protein KR054_004670, partial [Drosophila jambulina]